MIVIKKFRFPQFYFKNLRNLLILSKLFGNHQDSRNLLKVKPNASYFYSQSEGLNRIKTFQYL